MWHPVAPRTHPTHLWLTFEHWGHIPDTDWAESGELAEGDLQEHEWDPNDDNKDEVRKKEGTYTKPWENEVISLTYAPRGSSEITLRDPLKRYIGSVMLFPKSFIVFVMSCVTKIE